MRSLQLFSAALETPDLPRGGRAFVALIFALHLAFALFFVVAIPLHGGPDEIAHFAYVRQLATEHALPVLTDPRATRDSRTGAIAQHPPLTYLVNVPLYALTNGLGDKSCERVLRLTSVLWGVLSLVFCWKTLRENFPDQLALCLSAFAFAALLPHFLLLSSVLNNDGPLIFFSALFLWKWLQILRLDGKETVPNEARHRARDWAILGVIWGLALLSKATALLYIVPVTLVLLAQIARKKRGFVGGARDFGAFALPGMVLGGWWFARFYSMIGRIQPIPDLAEYKPILLSGPMDLLLDPNAPLLVGRFVAGAMRSIWGQVDWSFAPAQRDAMNQGFEFWPSLWGPTLPAPALFGLTLALYRLAVVFSVVAAAGLFARLIRRRFEAPLPLLVLWFGLLYASLGAYTLFKHPGFFEGGRYLLPALPATAALWMWGLGAWIPASKQKWLAPAVLVFFVAWDIGCAVNLTQFLVPLYAPKG